MNHENKYRNYSLVTTTNNFGFLKNSGIYTGIHSFYISKHELNE